MAIQPKIIWNPNGVVTGAAAASENASPWSQHNFPAIYDNVYTPTSGKGFFLGYKPIPEGSKNAWEVTHGMYYVNDEVKNDGSGYVCIVQHVADSYKEPGTGANWKDYWIGKESYLEVNVGKIGGWTITDKYLYNLASGVPGASENGGVVLAAAPADNYLGLSVFDTTPHLRVKVGQIDPSPSETFGLLVNDATGAEVFAAYGSIIRLAGANGWTFDKDGYITGVGGTIRTQNPIRDSGTGVGTLNTWTDSSKSWTNGEHIGKYLKDNSSVMFAITMVLVFTWITPLLTITFT